MQSLKELAESHKMKVAQPKRMVNTRWVLTKYRHRRHLRKPGRLTRFWELFQHGAECLSVAAGSYCCLSLLNLHHLTSAPLRESIEWKKRLLPGSSPPKNPPQNSKWRLTTALRKEKSRLDRKFRYISTVALVPERVRCFWWALVPHRKGSELRVN